MRSVTESEWDEQQQGWMLALAQRRAAECPCGCGYDVAVSLDPTIQVRVPPPTRCQVRTALAIAQKPYMDSPQPEALLFRAEVAGG